MRACRFCNRPADSQWAATVRYGESPNDQWRREIVYTCPRCWSMLRAAGREGRRLKATGETWYAGHSTGGVMPSLAADAMGREGIDGPKTN